jgi:hypothetical protein
MVDIGMIDTKSVQFAAVSERDLRRQIDRSVSRALVDGDYARLLLTDPSVALEDHGCAPQQYRSLRSIRANDLVDFARQVQALFWIVEPKPAYSEAQLPLAAAAAH